MAIGMTVDIWRARDEISTAVLLGVDRSSLLEARTTASPTVLPKTNTSEAKWRLALAGTAMALSLAWCVLCLSVYYGVHEPKRDNNMPCDGECEGCEEDPDCAMWVRDMLDAYPVLAICPPPPNAVETDVTFSCAADGYWMLCTSFIAGLWVLMTLCLWRQSARREALWDPLQRGSDFTLTRADGGNKGKGGAVGDLGDVGMGAFSLPRQSSAELRIELGELG